MYRSEKNYFPLDLVLNNHYTAAVGRRSTVEYNGFKNEFPHDLTILNFIGIHSDPRYRD